MLKSGVATAFMMCKQLPSLLVSHIVHDTNNIPYLGLGQRRNRCGCRSGLDASALDSSYHILQHFPAALQSVEVQAADGRKVWSGYLLDKRYTRFSLLCFTLYLLPPSLFLDFALTTRGGCCLD
jgi:hypothetical protein